MVQVSKFVIYNHTLYFIFLFFRNDAAKLEATATTITTTPATNTTRGEEWVILEGATEEMAQTAIENGEGFPTLEEVEW